MPGALAFLALGLLARAATAQVQLDEYQYPGPLGAIGAAVGVAGDVDGDGVQDVLVLGEPGAFTFSGATGKQLGFQPIPVVTGYDELIAVEGLDDIDGDGQLDLLISRAATGASAYSRATGTVLWTVTQPLQASIGRRLGQLDDLDRDGVRDLALGVPGVAVGGLSHAGTILVVSGATGALLNHIDGTVAFHDFGDALAAFDLDGDGSDEILVGDSQFSVGGAARGRLLVLGALDGGVLFELVGTTPTLNLGNDVADAGDLDGDGVHDMAALLKVGSTPRAAAWSGATGAPLWSTSSGSALIRSVGDCSGDAVPDLVVASAGFLGLSGFGNVFDGATGAVLGPLAGTTPSSFLSVAAPGDLTGDGKADLVSAHLGSDSMQVMSYADLRALPSGGVVDVYVNPPDGSRLGVSAATVGDFDGDGLDDVALGSSGDVGFFSRGSGELLFKLDLDGQEWTFAGGYTAIAGPGDVDGDGVPDLAVGEPNSGFTGQVKTYSGADGAVIASAFGEEWGESFGSAVVATTDHDDDGVRDLYVAAQNKPLGALLGVGQVQLRSGATLALLATYSGLPQYDGGFGNSIDASGDLNGDGVPELVVSSSEEQPGFTNSGTVRVLDGVTGAVLQLHTAESGSLLAFGACVGDGNGDEIPDILVAEPRWISGNYKPGRLRLMSGASGAVLWTREGPEPGSDVGWLISAAGDVNGDGYADLMCSAKFTAAGNGVVVYSGFDGATLDTIDLSPGTSMVNMGALLPMGRVDAGGCDDVLLGIPDLYGNGGARVFASSTGGVHGFTDLGHAKATSGGSVPTLRGYGGLDGGELVTIRVRHAPPSAVGAWFIGLSAGYLPFKQGVLVPNPAGPFFNFPVGTNGAGQFTLTAPNPNSVFTGLTLIQQMWFKDPAAVAGVAATNGMGETFK